MSYQLEVQKEFLFIVFNQHIMEEDDLLEIQKIPERVETVYELVDAIIFDLTPSLSVSSTALELIISTYKMLKKKQRPYPRLVVTQELLREEIYQIGNIGRDEIYSKMSEVPEFAS